MTKLWNFDFISEVYSLYSVTAVAFEISKYMTPSVVDCAAVGGS